MAHKKAAGTARNLRDSVGRRLGIKVFRGEHVKHGNIICRQRGTKWRAGKGTSLGIDHTIFAIQDGIVSFQEKKRIRYDGRKYLYTYINVINPATEKVKEIAPKKIESVKKVEEKTVTKAPIQKPTAKKTTVKKASTKKAAPKKSTAKKTTKKAA